MFKENQSIDWIFGDDKRTKKLDDFVENIEKFKKKSRDEFLENISDSLIRFVSRISLGNIKNDKEAYNIYDNTLNRENVKKLININNPDDNKKQSVKIFK